MRIATLTPDSAVAWFSAVSDVAPADAALEILARLLAAGPLAPDLRLVAEGGAGAFARFAAERRDKAIRFWSPVFRAETPAADRVVAMRGFVEALLARRSAAGLAQTPLETEPCDDEPDIADWFDVLREAGFDETSAYRLHILPRAGFALPRHAIPGLGVHSIEPWDMLNVGGLLRQAYAGTHERRERNFDAPEPYIAGLRAIGEGYEPGLWLMAEFAGKPAALAIVNRARESKFPGMSAWLLEIGCRPEFRGRGFARALLAEILHRLGSAGCERLLATIDELNAPSIRLHESMGFVAQSERFYFYRRAAP